MSEQVLPAVAKTIHLPCKKCAVDRFFIVVAHSSPTSAKVKCEVCGSQKTYKLPTEKKAKAASAAPKKSRASAASAAAKASHTQEYEKLVAEAGAEAKKYSMTHKFASKQKVEHPKFGVGVVRTVMPEKIEVLFADEVRMLVHNRT